MLAPRQLPLFLLCIILHNESISNSGIYSEYAFAPFLAYSIAVFAICLRELRSVHKDAHKGDEDAHQGDEKLHIQLCNMIYWFLSLLCVTASINYITYICFPEQFSVPENLTVFETAFEFLYYSFTLMMTYSSDGISANSMLSKCFQMIEILCFIVFVATTINTFAENIMNSKSIDTHKINDTPSEQSDSTKSQKCDTIKRKRKKKNH